MKVAIVYPFFPHYREGILRELKRSRHQFVFVGDTRDPSGKVKGLTTSAIPISIARCVRLPGGLVLQKGLISVALQQDLDVIIYMAEPKLPMIWVSACLARLTGKRILFWTHGWTRRDKAWIKYLRRLFYRIPHALLLYGHYAKCLGIEAGFSSDRLYVGYNNLACAGEPLRQLSGEEIHRIRCSLFDNPELPMLICTGRLMQRKRIDLLIDAVNVLRERKQPVNLLLVGDGPERSSLERRAAELAVPVAFYGECYDETVLSLLIGAADLAVSPGAIGLTAIHSLAYGTPVATYEGPAGQGPEWECIIPGMNGALFARNDVAQIVDAIEQWARRARDPAIRNRCRISIERHYTPQFQRHVIERAVDGLPADDLMDSKEWINETTCAAESTATDSREGAQFNGSRT